MVPVRLWMRNFLSYGPEGQEVDFSGVRVAALVGPNGAGKSSLLDAITWALFGRARGSREEIVRKGATEAEVLLEFTVNGQRYRVHRRYSQKSKKLSATLDQHDAKAGKWRPLASGAKAVEGELHRLLRMDHDTFVRTVFVPQGQHGEFMTLMPYRRRDTLAEILGLGDYETWAKKASDRIKELDGQIRSAQQEVERIAVELQNRPLLQQQLQDTERQMKSAREHHERLRTERQRWQREHEGLMQKDVERQNLLQALMDWENQAQATQQRIDILRQQCDQFRVVLAQEDAIMTAVEELRRKEKEEERLRQTERRLQSLLQRRQQLQHAVEQARIQLESELRLAQKERTARERDLAETEGLLRRRPEVERRLNALGQARQELARWDDNQRRWMDLQRQRREIEGRIAEEQATLERREGELLATQRRYQEIVGQKAIYQGQAQKLDEALRRLEEWQRRSEQAQQQRHQLSAQLAQLQAQRDETEQKLRLLREHAGEPRCPLCESLLTPESFEALQRRLQAWQAQLGNEYARTERQISQLDAFLQKAQVELSKRPELERRKGEVTKALNDIAQAEDRLQAIQQQLDELRRQRAEAEKRWEKWRSELMRKEEEIGYDEKRHAQARQQVEELTPAEVEKQRLDEAEQKAKQLRHDIAQLDRKIAELRRSLEEGDYAPEERQQLQQLKVELDALNYDPERHEDLRRWLQENRENILRRRQQIDDAKRQLPQTERQLEQEQQRLAELRQRVAQAQRRLQELDSELQRWEGVKARLNEIDRQLLESEEKLRRLSGELQTLKTHLDTLSEREKQKREREREIEGWQQERQDYELLAEAFGRNGIPKEILKAAVQWIEQEANELLVRLTGGKMFLRFVLTQPLQSKEGERETLDIVIADSLGDRPYQSYSGGEKFRVDIAVRIALARLLARRSGAALRTLVIDEGFGSQDKEGLESVVDAIQTVAKEFDLVLVVTHLDALRDQFPTLIEVTKDSKGSRCRLIKQDNDFSPIPPSLPE